MFQIEHPHFGWRFDRKNKRTTSFCVVFGARVLCYFSNSVHKKPARFLRPAAKGQGLHGTLRPSQPWNLAGKPWGGPLMVSLVLDPPWLLGSVCGFLLKSTKRGCPPKTNTVFGDPARASNRNPDLITNSASQAEWFGAEPLLSRCWGFPWTLYKNQPAPNHPIRGLTEPHL